MGIFTLRFTSPGLTPVTSGPITVTPPPTFGPGPNFSAGLSAIPGVQDIRGNLLPGIGTANAQGQVAAFGQVDQLSTASSPSNPSGSGMKMRLKMPGSTQTVDCWLTWAPPDFGGRASSRYRETPSLVGLGLNWQEINIRRRFNVTAGWTNQVRSCTETTVQNFTATGSTPTQINAPAGTFTPDQFNPALNGGVTHYIRATTGNVEKAYKIVGNTATGIQIDPAFPGSGTNWIANGRAMRIFRAAATGASPAFNAGTKHFWPRLVVDCAAVNTTVHGQAVSLPARTNVPDRENNYVTLTGEPGATAEGYSFQYRLQINDWDGVTTDGQGAVGVDGAVTFGAVQRLTSYGVGRQSVATYPFGVPMNVEYKLRLNTPGQADGLFQVFINESGTPLANATNVEALPRYVFTTVNVGGVNYTVPQPVTAARFDYVLKDPTLGGGLGVPDLDQYLEEEAVVFRGKNVPVPSAKPNPQLLPLAQSGAGSIAPNMATIGTLQANTPAGGTYTDPYTGVTVLKLTGNGTPTAGNHEHGYAEGNARISQSWIGPDGQRYSSIVTGDAWLHDVRHSDMAVTRRVQIPGGFTNEMGACWSMNPATPRIIFLVRNGNRVDRFDTQTMTLANTTGWPWTPSRPSGASGNLEWLHTSVNDTWMSFQWNGSPATAVGARRMPDGLERTWSPVNFDEHHLDKSLPYIYRVDGERPNIVWNLETDAKITVSDPGNHIATDHSGTIRGALVGTGYWLGGGGAFYYRPDTGQVGHFITSDAGFHGASNDWYNQGLWVIDQPSEVFTQQWFTADRFQGDDSGAKIRRGMCAFVRLDGEVRLIAAQGSAVSGPGDYDWYPQTNTAIDGRLVMWTSNMNGQGGGFQVFVARIPTS